ncbi:uncharacterized protein LOC112528400 isoform X3 [Cynara cardunculus var. scolymus]|uniref:Heavy metal-associated domain, HMA n=1 Tax=Cynara cardunculus var. scolymus TaxID=59895 RepID=A0A118JX49_CYNCS|nr:uncharacterized protein LOC112528400 isoform X3 [Cynara cardunculus var. scolymus]KVH96296.1 hypothetical protein Ccrd_001617 [Cynara cardunculus var. scolymus]
MRRKKKNEEEEEEKSNKLIEVSTTLASVESLTFPLVQEVVLLADFGCKKCEDRVAGIVSRLNGEMESMEIMVMEKKVIFTFTSKYSREIKTCGKKLEVATIYKHMAKKIFNVKRFLRALNT